MLCSLWFLSLGHALHVGQYGGGVNVTSTDGGATTALQPSRETAGEGGRSLHPQPITTPPPIPGPGPGETTRGQRYSTTNMSSSTSDISLDEPRPLTEGGESVPGVNASAYKPMRSDMMRHSHPSPTDSAPWNKGWPVSKDMPNEAPKVVGWPDFNDQRPVGCEETHTVQSNQTLYEIGTFYDLTFDELMDANPKLVHVPFRKYGLPTGFLICLKTGTLTNAGFYSASRGNPPIANAAAPDGPPTGLHGVLRQPCSTVSEERTPMSEAGLD